MVWNGWVREFYHTKPINQQPIQPAGPPSEAPGGAGDGGIESGQLEIG